MKENATNGISKTNWEKVDALTENEIDTSDIPPLDEDFFEDSKWWKPPTPLNVLVKVDPTTLSWFQSQGEDYEQKMAAALRIYAEEHKEDLDTEQVPAA
ncbi:MAG: hypothetical protein AAF810_07670 [Cyanobacteria bacterium P01_D01_bin.36]